MQGEKGVKLQGTMSDSALARALALVRDLRARCPWDRAQTPQTLRPYLVEEVLELDQALKHDAAAALRDELGDLLLHLAFQIVIGEERKTLDAESVTRALEEKMWRRHPQLFGHAETPDHEAWERAKQRERYAPWLAAHPAGAAHGLPAAGTRRGGRVRLAGPERAARKGERGARRTRTGNGRGETGKARR